uniref:Paralemmin-1 n=1 Tax=Erpetoichthys calabaricus TaxID=27687 RepID=A0A8C4XI59_ERPCA
MELTDTLIQQERLQAITEKRKRQTEIENKRRQLEDERRQLQYLKSKALRERWLLDGAPSSTSVEDEAMKKQMQEDEAKTKSLDETIQRLEQELEELESGVSATSTKENLSEAAKEETGKTGDGVSNTPVGSTKAVRVHKSPRLDKSGGHSDMMKAVVHEVRVADGTVENGVHLLSSTEVEELIHKADEVSMSDVITTKDGETIVKNGKSTSQTPKKEITGIEAKPTGTPQKAGNGNNPSQEHPVTMVFMGYQNVEDEAETKKVLGLEGTIKAELVVIEDREGKMAAEDGKQAQQDPPNGSAAEAPKDEDCVEKGEAEQAAGELNSKEKQPCKCCSVM